MTNTRPIDPVAAEIRANLGRQNRSQRWLSDAIGMSAPALSRRLSGDRSFSIDELRTIASALGVQVTDLIPAGVAA